MAAKKKASFPRMQKVMTPEWEGPGYVFVRAPSVKALAKIFAITKKMGQEGEIDEVLGTATMCTYAICDETAALTYAPGDIEEIGEMDAAPLFRIADAIHDLAGLSEKAVKEMEKNSGNQRGSSRSS